MSTRRGRGHLERLRKRSGVGPGSSVGGTQPEGGIHCKHIGLPQPRGGDVKAGTGSGEFPVGVIRRMSAGGEKGVVWRRGWSRA